MNMLYLIVPISVLLLALAIGVFLWAVRSGQYEDLDGPSVRILLDDDDDSPPDENAKHRNDS